MIDAVVLDTGPLGMIAHPRAKPEITSWIDELLAAGVRVIVPAIADYELRREHLHMGMTNSLRRLDELKVTLEFMPMTQETMLLAAELWADSRRRGRSTADKKELDGDAILAAQARLTGVSVVVATTNVGHLDQWVAAAEWEPISSQGIKP